MQRILDFPKRRQTLLGWSKITIRGKIQILRSGEKDDKKLSAFFPRWQRNRKAFGFQLSTRDALLKMESPGRGSMLRFQLLTGDILPYVDKINVELLAVHFLPLFEGRTARGQCPAFSYRREIFFPIWSREKRSMLSRLSKEVFNDSDPEKYNLDQRIQKKRHNLEFGPNI